MNELKKTQKNKILMDFKLFLFAIGSMLISCGTNKEITISEPEEDPNHTIILKFSRHIPHCGGAAPTPEQINGYSEAISGKTYAIFEHEYNSNKKPLTESTTNKQGVIEIKLSSGKFAVVDKQKLLPLNEFIEKNTPDNIHYRSQDSLCFETWKSKPDFTIDIQNDTIIMLTERHQCFTGANPCIEYVGPYPP